VARGKIFTGDYPFGPQLSCAADGVSIIEAHLNIKPSTGQIVCSKLLTRTETDRNEGRSESNEGSGDIHTTHTVILQIEGIPTKADVKKGRIW